MTLKRSLVGLALALVALILAWRPVDAWAVDDSVDSWQIAYTVDTSGVLHVHETLVYRFGSNSGRHGIDRVLVTREPWGTVDQDAVYTITNIQVTSPDAPASFTTTTMGSGRDLQLRIRVGSASQTVSAPTATYTLTYDVAGAMRNTPASGSDPGYDELYWDAIGDNTPMVNHISITASVPGGVLEAVCYNGPARSTTPCDSATVGTDGVATYTVASKAGSDLVTVAAKIKAGLISNNQPNLQPAAQQGPGGPTYPGQTYPSQPATNMGAVGGVAAGAAALTAAGVGVLGARNRRDQRFLGVAPGTVETSGQGIGPDNHPTIPVAFTPPKIPVAAAGLIDDGAVDVRDTTAALLSLAVRGAIQLRQDQTPTRSWVFGGGGGDKTIYARLVDPTVPMAPHEAKLLSDVFSGRHVGTEVSLTTPGKLYKAHQDMCTNVRAEAASAGWYVRMPSERTTAASQGGGAAAASIIRGFFIAVWAIVFFGGVGITGLLNSLMSGRVGWLMWVGPLAILIIGFLIYKGMTARGQRSAVGRAYADQVTGFREYLTTAEADQIKFEEGQDVFSQYLPWAVIFGVADRWTKICAQLVEQGRLMNIQPTWYYGDYRLFNMYVFTNALNSIDRASMPMTPSGSGWSSSGTGFGGGSAFGGGFGGGGGFSGGGGGGGGVSSW